MECNTMTKKEFIESDKEANNQNQFSKKISPKRFKN